MWELDYKESWPPKNLCFWTVVLEETLESLLSRRRSNQSIIKEISPNYSPEGLMLKLKLQYFGHLMRRTDSLKRPWCWERLKAGGKWDDRGCDGWTASPTQWTWVWASSGSSWRTGKPGVLQSMRSQRVGYNLATEMKWREHKEYETLKNNRSLKNCSSVLLVDIRYASIVPKDSSVQFSRVWLCDPMNHSMPGLPVYHQLPEFTQTHAITQTDAIQPSHPLLSPSPPALNPSQHQGLFQWINSSREVVKVPEYKDDTIQERVTGSQLKKPGVAPLVQKKSSIHGPCFWLAKGLDHWDSLQGHFNPSSDLP